MNKVPAFKINSALFDQVAAHEMDMDGTRANQREDNARLAERKMHDYSALVADIWSVKLVKGNFPTAVKKILQEGFTVHAGLKPAKVNRYMRGLAGISRSRKVLDIPEPREGQNDFPQVIFDCLKANGLISENALFKFLKGDDEDNGELDAMVAKLVGSFSQRKVDDGKGNTVSVPGIFKPGKLADQFDLFMDKIRDMQRIANAAEQAATEQAKENATYDEIMAVLAMDEAA